MSVISVNFDTKTKVLEATLDGEKVMDLMYISIYTNLYGDSADEGHIELVKLRTDEENGMTERICIYASHTENHIEPTIDLNKLSENIGKGFRERKI